MPKLMLHDQRFAQWLRETFKMSTAAEAFKRITELDTLAETITVDGQERPIPGECYMTWAEMEAIPVPSQPQQSP